MKSAITFFICLMTIIFKANAQSGKDIVDPLQGKYILNKSTEVILQYAKTDGTQNRAIYDVVANDFALANEENPELSSISGDKEMAVTTGDIDGDYEDEVISCWETDNHSIVISVPDISESSLSFEGNSTITLNSVLKTSMRIITADLDDDPKKEVILAYHGLDDLLHVLLYQVNDNNTLELTSENFEMPIQEYIAGKRTMFEIAAGDFDGDGTDELVAMNVLFSTVDVKTRVNVYDFNSITENFTVTASKEIINQCFAVSNSSINEFAITTGDFNGDRLDEVAYAFEGGSWADPEYRRAARGSMLEIGEKLDNITHEGIKSFEIDYRTDGSKLLEGFSLSLCSGDLNNDGKDELMGVGSYFFRVFERTTEAMEFSQVGDPMYIPAKYDFKGHHMLAVANVDSDTTTRDANLWNPEIILAGFHTNILIIWGIEPIFNENKSIANFSITKAISTELPSDSLYTMVLALGDFDGDGLMLGPPKDISRPSTLIPSIILNAPPSHFDILNNQVYDVNFYHETGASTQYSDESNSESTISTEMENSWGLSSEISAGGSIFGVAVSASINTNFSQTFSNSQSQTKTVSISSTNSARIDDKIHGISSDFSLFEYPVFFKHQPAGNMLVSIPNPPFNKTWKESTSLTPNTYSLIHEPGNLLSYPAEGEIVNREDYIAQGSYGEIPFTELSTNTNSSYSISIAELNESTMQKEQEFGIGMEVSASGWGCSASFRGDYSNSSLASHKTSISDAFAVTINLESIDKGIGEVEYEVKPIIYWSKRGALVVDYEVKLTGKWWSDNYGKKPDLAFIMPFRYGPEKGINFEESKRMMTSDIRYFPYDAIPGDTVDILTTVRNFSLKDLDGNVKVQFYLGNPDFDSELISDIDGNSEFYVSNVKSRESKDIQFRWVTPSEMPENPWIFAVIDPDDAIDEIHSNNNMGFVPLFLTNEYPPYQKRIETITSVEEIRDPIHLSNYPNPAQSETTICFYLEKESGVQLQIFNAQGKKIGQILIDKGKKGLNEIPLNISAYQPGIYYYVLSAGKSQVGKKLIIN